jgi:hypothetical protein
MARQLPPTVYGDSTLMRVECVVNSPDCINFPLRIEEVYLTPACELIICSVEGHFPPDLKRPGEIACRSAIERYEGVRHGAVPRVNPRPGRSAVGWAETCDCSVRCKREYVWQPQRTIWCTRNNHPRTDDAIGLGAGRRSGDCKRDSKQGTQGPLSQLTFLPSKGKRTLSGGCLRAKRHSGDCFLLRRAGDTRSQRRSRALVHIAQPQMSQSLPGDRCLGQRRGSRGSGGRDLMSVQL